MMSMPFESDKAVDFATSLKKWFQFHSTVDVLKDPPAGYLSPAVDVLGGMDDIIQLAKANSYASHYAFESAINNLIAQANDGHLSINGLCTQNFIFQRPQGLVSLSEDGVELPQLYIDSDARLIGTKFVVSPVSTIEGIPAAKYLEAFSSTQGFQDPDARYNSLFVNSAVNSTGSLGGIFVRNQVWPGTDSTELVFSNGSTMHLPTLASFRGKHFNYTSGDAFYKDLCLNTPSPTNSTSTSAPSSAPSELATKFPKNFPEAVFSVPGNLIAGFYPEKMNDTAVLYIPTFEPTGNKNQTNELTDAFVEGFQKFLGNAPKDGKTRLVIDMTGNPGGETVLGYNLYANLFPDKEITGYVNYRAHPAARVLTELASNIDISGDLNDSSAVTEQFDAFSAVLPDQKTTFKNWQQLYGPYPGLKTNVTAIQGPLNFSSGGIEGYDPDVPTPLPSAPFKPENILILTDGQCTSTCNLLTTLLRHEAGVKTLTLGGRPQTGTMTPSGGSKGAQVMPYTWVDQLWDTLDNVEGNTTLLNAADFKIANETMPERVDDLPFVMSAETEVNFYNNYAKEDQLTPLQFVYEPSECRLFYTANMWFQPEVSWLAAADAWWGNGACVQGSVPHHS